MQRTDGGGVFLLGIYYKKHYSTYKHIKQFKVTPSVLGKQLDVFVQLCSGDIVLLKIVKHVTIPKFELGQSNANFTLLPNAHERSLNEKCS